MILLVAYGGGHVAVLAPIAQELRRRGVDFVFLGLTTARAYLQRLDIPAIGFRDLPEADDALVQGYGRQLARDLPAGGAVAVEETVAYLGLNFRDLVVRHGAAEAEQLYREQGRQAFFPLQTMVNAIQSMQPDLVIATSSPRAERAAIAAARQCDVPAVCVVDLFARQEIKWVGEPGYADRVCVLNEAVRDAFVAYGRRADEVVVTGNPAFDALRTPEAVLAGSAMRAARGWGDGLKTILWASQMEPALHPFSGRAGDPTLPARIEQYLRDFVAGHPDWRLVVRYHPSQREVFVAQPQVEFSPVEENLAALLHAVDVVVVTASTVGLQASIAGRPVISVDCSVISPDTRFSESGVSTGVAGVEDLGAALRRLAVRGDAASAAAGEKQGGTAAENVMRIIDSLR